jgi:hypothetical protein
MALTFNGKSGRKPQTEARRYVYRIIASMLANDAVDGNGWLLGGLDEEPDRRRVKKAQRAVQLEMARKASK